MKTLAVVCACFACCASSGWAAVLSIEWTAGQVGTAQDTFAGVGDVKQVDIAVDLITGENLNTVFFEFESVGGTGSVNATLTGDITTSITDWEAIANLGVPPTGELGGLGVQVASASTAPLTNLLFGPGRFVVGTFDLEITAGAFGDVGEIAIDNDQTVGLLSTLPSGAARFYVYNAQFAGPGGGDYSGYYRYGIGSPFVAEKFGQARDPLRVTIPEPTSLILLGVGAIVLRRRS